MNLPAAFEARMRALLGSEYAAYADSFTQPPQRCFRVNTEKISVPDFLALGQLGSTPVPYVPTGFYLETEKAGNHPFHHAGMVYIQDGGAMASAECAPVPEEGWVLDLCAAPGGKSSQLRNKLGPKGVLVSNEIIPGRCRILTGNMERLGFRNTITTCLAPKRLAELFPHRFDYIMVDAPCSGEGMFRKDETAIAEWSEDNVLRCQARQAEILDWAVEALRPGGTIVYSTCTFSLEENEMTVDSFLTRHGDFTLAPAAESVRAATAPGISFPGCRCLNLQECRRFYPHVSRGEGQFMAVLRHTAPLAPRAACRRKAEKIDPVLLDFLKDTLTDFDPAHVTVYNGTPVYFTPDFEVPKGAAFSCGVTLGELRRNYIQPHHQCFMALGPQFRRKLELTGEALDRYLHGEEVDAPGLPNGWAVVMVHGCSVGGVKVVNGRGKNHYPKGLRTLK